MLLHSTDAVLYIQIVLFPPSSSSFFYTFSLIGIFNYICLDLKASFGLFVIRFIDAIKLIYHIS